MAHSKVYTTPKRSLWEFGTRAVVMAAIGAALYGVLSYLTNVLQIPSAANVSIRPAVALVFFFGLAFGPVVGFITGFLGNTIADLLSGYGFWIWWGIGNGLMGLVAGLFANMMTDYRSMRDLGLGETVQRLGFRGAAAGVALGPAARQGAPSGKPEDGVQEVWAGSRVGGVGQGADAAGLLRLRRLSGRARIARGLPRPGGAI